mmetsp:Transcript_13455/g.11952  ORF Transcript_13455/g.11952 Transcript_13455/m.11952 type:complete len:118 (+) Transcript_13455:199-552(+)
MIMLLLNKVFDKGFISSKKQQKRREKDILTTVKLIKKQSDNPFGNLEEVILGDDAIGAQEDDIEQEEVKISLERDIKPEKAVKIEGDLSKILSYLGKIMKPFDSKKGNSKIPSREKI